MIGPLRYEWVRISTVRSTSILLGLVALICGALGFIVGFLSDTSESDATSTAIVMLLLPVIASILCTIGAASFGQEYRHGLIRVTLSIFPRREPVFVAKALMVALVTLFGAVIAIALIMIGQALGGLLSGKGAQWDASIFGATGLWALLYVLVFVLIAFAITALTRNQPLGIIAPIILATFIEPVVGPLLSVLGWTWIDWIVPFNGGVALVSVSTEGAEAWGHLGVFGLWFAVLAIPAWILFLRRDA